MSDYLFKAIKAGLLKRNRNPGLIKTVSLNSFIRHCPNIDKLCSCIAYSIIYDVDKRVNKEWSIVFNSFPNKPIEYWHSIALYSYSENLHTFNDLICINFKILRENPDEFFKKYPSLRQTLLTNIRIRGNE